MMMDGPPVVVTRPLSMTEDPQIQRIRKCLFIINGVFLAPCLILIILIIILTLTQASSSNDQGGHGPSLGWSLFIVIVPVILYSFGIFVAYRYSATGLRVFAWLWSIVLCILVGIGVFMEFIIYIYMRPSASSSRTGNNKRSGYVFPGSIGMYTELIIVTAAFGLTILKIVLAFKLARLIDAKTSLATQPI